MEDLKTSDISKHFSQSNENISRRLEKALYNKLQFIGLIPPHIKDIIHLRESIREKQKSGNQSGRNAKKEDVKRSSQIGVIVFVDETDTSKTCPYCENKDIQSNDVKYRQKRFICGDTACCGFDTYHFTSEEERVEDYEPHVNNNINKNKFDFLKDINDPDKVAAYNIAKKITDPEKIGKMNQDF